MVCFLGLGLPQPAEGPHHGGAGHCAAGHGHPHPGCARPHGGRPPDVDPLDPKNYCRGGTHGTAARPHTASHRAALQGKNINRSALVNSEHPPSNQSQLKILIPSIFIFIWVLPQAVRETRCVHPQSFLATVSSLLIVVFSNCRKPHSGKDWKRQILLKLNRMAAPQTRK